MNNIIEFSLKNRMFILILFAGLLAGSIALIGFCLDSFVESLSGGVMFCMCTKMLNRALTKVRRFERTFVYSVSIKV